MEILYYVLTFYLGAFVGFLLNMWLRSRASYTGIIHITRDAEKTLYSLELNEYPEEIRLHKEVVFKVDASDIENFEKNLDRD